MILSRIRAKLRDESGLTLVELTVVVALLSAVMAFALQSVVSYQTAATGGIHRLENLDEARTLMQVITKDVRTAAKLDATTSPFIVNTSNPTMTLADDNEVWFYANLDLTTACPKKVRIYVDGSQRLIEAIYDHPLAGSPATGTCTSYPPSPTRTRFVGKYVANTTGQPIFTYYSQDTITGALVPFCGAVGPGCAQDQTPLTVTNGVQVKAVGIRLAIRKNVNSYLAYTTLENTVRLPNVYYYPAPSTSP